MTARFLIPLLVSLGVAGAAAAQGYNVDPSVGTGGAASPIAVRQCNGSVENPVPVIAGCTAIINSRQSTAVQRSAAYTNRARAFLRRDQADRALADFDLAVMLDPRNSRAWANRGDFYSAMGEFDRAVEDYDRAIAANPEDFEAYSQRGNVRLMSHQDDRNPFVIEAFQNAHDFPARFCIEVSCRFVRQQ